MTRQQQMPCPELETIAAYLDARLTERERARVAEHLTSCESCYFVFTEAVATTPTAGVAAPDTADGRPMPWWRTRPVLWSSAAGLAAAAVLLLAVAPVISRWRAIDSPELHGLVEAVGTTRPIEPRLTGGFAHGPFRSAVRSGSSTTPPVSPDVAIAAARIEKAVTGELSARALGDLGIARLVTGRVAGAVAALETAAGLVGAPARIFSDLSAAYLTRGAETGDRQDFMKALAAAERAVGSDPRLAEAWFNRASALDRLAVGQPPRDGRLARDAWLNYLDVDAGSAWALEARAHVTALDATQRPTK